MILNLLLFSFLFISFISANQVDYVSQYGQDRYFIEELFKDKHDGFFVDIGANDGVKLSNTYCLEKLGWHGICIEPIIPAFNKLKENRTCITLNCCVGPVQARAPFLHVIGGCEMLSGLYEYLDPRHKERILLETALNRGSLEMVMLDCYRLDQILDAFNITHVDLLKIDTEGSELAILRSIFRADAKEYNRFSFSVLCIEDNYDNESEISHILNPHGFVLIKRIGCDLIYRKES